MTNETDIDEVPGVENLFDLVLHDFAPRFLALADQHGVSNEDLQRFADAMRPKGEGGGYGLATAGLCLVALANRRSSQLIALIAPGEIDARGGVPVSELVEREARLKGHA